MEIKFNSDLSRLHDAVDGLINCYKDNYKLMYEEYNLNLNKAAEEALIFIGENIDYNIPHCDLLFGSGTRTASAFVTSRFITPDLSIDNFVDYLKALSDDEVRLIILSNLKPKAVSYDEILPISQDGTKILNFLRELGIPSSIKWEALEFMNNVKASMKGFIDLLERYIPIYKKVLKKNKKGIEEFENYIESNIKSDGETFFANLLDGSLSLEADQVTTGILFFSSRSLICTTVGEKLYVFVGMDFEETVKLVTGDGEADYFINVYKNLSDKTRFQILNMLKDKELYGQEIAERVGITMATVSYHMSNLLAVNLVKLEKVGQKGYYTLKKDTLKKSIDYLSDMFRL